MHTYPSTDRSEKAYLRLSGSSALPQNSPSVWPPSYLRLCLHQLSSHCTGVKSDPRLRANFSNCGIKGLSHPPPPMGMEGRLGGKETSLPVRASEHGTSCQLRRLQPSARQEAPDRTQAPAGHRRRIGASLGVMLRYFQTSEARQKANSALPQTLLLTAGG